MNAYWQGKRVLVTGGGGFIGSAVVAVLRARAVPPDAIVAPRSRNIDLRRAAACTEAVRGCDVVIHLAAPTGGIAYARAHPALQYRDCSLINLNMFEAAREAAVGRFVSLGNLLAYPATAKSPLRETCLHDGAVAETHLGIGLAKRDQVALGQMYRREYGMDVVSLLAANAYGPGDRFDPEHAHVVPATIIKCGRDEDLVVWGDGTPTRDFLYVEDIAEGIVLAAERADAGAVINIASGAETSIGELVRLVAELSGFRRRIVFDPAKGGGDPRRVADVTLARAMGFSPRVSLRDGLARTIDAYRRGRPGV